MRPSQPGSIWTFWWFFGKMHTVACSNAYHHFSPTSNPHLRRYGPCACKTLSPAYKQLLTYLGARRFSSRLPLAAVAVAVVLSACGGDDGGLPDNGNDNGTVQNGGSGSSNYVVTTIAGQFDNPGFADGPAASALFANAIDVALGPNDSLYIADPNNQRIRVLTADGMVSTVAGGSTATSNGILYRDGPCASATFAEPLGLAVDATGNVYVADITAIRKITNPTTSSCAVNTLAGSPQDYGHTDGTGSAARFSGLVKLTLDTAGNLYATEGMEGSDILNGTYIRKITSAGVVTTVAGNPNVPIGDTDGPAASASFNAPMGIALDQQGNLYVADSDNNAIRKITPSGTVSTWAGSPTDAPGFANGTRTAATFNQPWSLTFDTAGNLYVGDAGNSAVRMITPAGVVSTLAGTGSQGHTDGPAAQAEFWETIGLAVDVNGAVYVADGYTIRKIAKQ